jgi:hypothetical protein
MLPIILYLVIILPVLIAAGALLHQGNRFICQIASGSSQPFDHRPALDEALVLGIVAITISTSIISIFHRINLSTCAVICVTVLFFGRRHLAQFLTIESARASGLMPGLTALGAFLCGAALVLLATSSSTHYDTGLYHAQLVVWTKEYGAVPGLANLHSRLGFNSSWDVFASFLDQSYFSGRSTHIVELIVCLMLLLVSLRGLRNWMSGDRSVATLMRIFSLVLIVANYHGAILVSFSSDWPIIGLIYYAVLVAVEQIETNESSTPIATLVRFSTCATVCFFAITVKMSSLPLVGVLLIWLRPIFESKAVRTALFLSAGFILIPFIARNIILSGYIAFPFSQLDLFSFDWKVPKEEVNATASLIRNWAVSPTSNWYRVTDMDWKERFSTWLQWRGSETLPIAFTLSIGVLAWIGLCCFQRVRQQREFKLFCAICLVLLAGLVFGFLAAPDVRFFAGWVWAFTLLAIAWLCIAVMRSMKTSQRILQSTAYAFLFFCTLWMLRYSGIGHLFVERGASLWTIDQLSSPSLTAAITESGLSVGLPTITEQCWNASQPSTPSSEFNPWLQARGETLADGFRATRVGTRKALTFSARSHN